MRDDLCSTCGKGTRGAGASDLWSFRNILVGLLIIAATVVIASNYQHRQDTAEIPLLAGTVNVGPGGLYYVSFHLNNRARIVGRFQASGRSNDIQAVIADADEFENWKNGHTARLIYQTDRTTVGKIDSVLRPGDYYLGFNNKFSLLTSKTVTGDIRVKGYQSLFVEEKNASGGSEFFTFDAQNSRYAAAVHQDGVYLGPAGFYGNAIVTKLAKSGETILLFGAGFARPTQRCQQIVHSPGAAPVPGDLTIIIGNVIVPVQFAGISSNGLYQFNVIFPPLPNGDYEVSATFFLDRAASMGHSYRSRTEPTFWDASFRRFQWRPDSRYAQRFCGA